MNKWEKAYDDYLAGMKYKEIAEKYGVSINTVKSWKSRKWGAPPDKKVAHKTKKVATKKKVQPVIDNDDLTEQQKLFCLYYLQSFNATKAYQQAYGCDYNSARANSIRLLAKDSIKTELHRLKAELQQDMLVDVKDLMMEYIKQAFADITDFVEFGTKKETETVTTNNLVASNEIDENGMPVMENETKEVEFEYSFVHLKDSSEVDGTMIQEVKKGKDGVSVKLHDKHKAMAELMKYLGGDRLREAQIASAIAKNKDGSEEFEMEDDGFLAALEAEGEELWPEE